MLLELEDTSVCSYATIMTVSDMGHGIDGNVAFYIAIIMVKEVNPLTNTLVMG